MIMKGQTQSLKQRRKQTTRSARMAAQRYHEALVRAEEEAKNHPEVLALDTYCFNRDRLSRGTIEKIEAHLAVCARCRESVAYSAKHAEFFKHQQTVLGDCE
jgi:hypothetical protein